MKNLNFSFSETNLNSKRIEVALRDVFSQISRRQFIKLLDDKEILLNSKIAKKGFVVSYKDEISLPLQALDFEIGSARLSSSEDNNREKQDKNLSIVFEDDSLLVIKKPRAMHSVVIKYSDPMTLADLIADYSSEAALAGRSRLEAGLVQRLDYYTSGLIIAAKDRDTWESLHQQFLDGNVLKTYVAKVWGKTPSTLNTAIFSLTTLGSDEKTSKIKITTTQGGQHIIRTVCAEEGFPLVGDSEYGNRSEDNQDGFHLHAAGIKLIHPHQGKILEFSDEPNF